jgi:hypothetical protein
MRNGFVAMVMLMSTAGIASAQVGVSPAQTPEVQLTSDDVVARLMFFDRNHDGRVAMAELSERMQPLVIRGDASRDGALDASEIRRLSAAFPVTQLQNAVSSGRYGFADSVGQSSRMHIDNTIDDLRLSPELARQAKSIGSAFADEIEAAARVHLRAAIVPMLTPEAQTIFDADLARLATTRTVVLSDSNGPFVLRTIMMVGTNPATLLTRYQFSFIQLEFATTAVETFKAETQQLDDVHRGELVARLSGILNEEACDDVSAALARRPLVKSGSVIAGATGSAAALTQLQGALMSAVAFRTLTAPPAR